MLRDSRKCKLLGQRCTLNLLERHQLSVSINITHSIKLWDSQAVCGDKNNHDTKPSLHNKTQVKMQEWTQRLALLTCVRKTPPSSTAMFSYFPSFFLYSQWRGVKSELRGAIQPTSQPVTCSQSVSQHCPYLNLTGIPFHLGGKIKVSLAQVTEQEENKKKIQAHQLMQVLEVSNTTAPSCVWSIHRT